MLTLLYDLLLTLFAALPWCVPLFFWCTCCGCTAFTDDYSTDQLATAYNTRSGSWSVGSGVLTTTSSGALLRCESEVNGRGRVTVTAKLSTASGSWRLIGSYADDDNYLFVEFAYTGVGNNYTIKLYDRTAGANTQMGRTLTGATAAGNNVQLFLCWDGDHLAMGGPSTSGTEIILGEYSGVGTKAGVGASPGATATFDNFTLSRHKADNSTCFSCQPCTTCTEGTQVAQVMVEFSGVANGTCGTCNDFNTTAFILDLENSAGCRYAISAGVPCAIDYVYCSLPGALKAVVINEASAVEAWSDDATSTSDCSTGESLAMSNLIMFPKCSFSAATTTFTPQ